MRTKTIATFEYTLHKELWNLLAENPSWTKTKAMRVLKERGTVSENITYDCFACDAQYHIEGHSYTDKEGTRRLRTCTTSNCPLYWGSDEYDYHGCTETIDGRNDNGLFSRWLNAVDDIEERRKLAEQIRDLPLREGAESIYTIV